MESVEAGCAHKVAAGAAGIGVTTFYSWIARGRTGDQPYADFLDALHTAEAVAEDRAVKLVANAALTTWQAAAWFLERKHYDRWARRDKVEHSGNAFIPLAAVLKAAVAAGTMNESGREAEGG